MFKKLVFTISLFLTVLYSFAQDIEKLYYLHFDKAVDLNKSYNYKEAIDELKKCKLIAPEKISAYLFSAEIYFKIRNFDEQKLELDEALKIDKNDYRIYYNHAKREIELKLYKDALNNYNYIIKNLSKEPIFYLERGSTYVKMKKNKEACLDFKTALFTGSITARDSIDKYCKGKF